MKCSKGSCEIRGLIFSLKLDGVLTTFLRSLGIWFTTPLLKMWRIPYDQGYSSHLCSLQRAKVVTKKRHGAALALKTLVGNEFAWIMCGSFLRIWIDTNLPYSMKCCWEWMWELLGCIWKTVFAITLGNSSSGRVSVNSLVAIISDSSELWDYCLIIKSLNRITFGLLIVKTNSLVLP